MTSRSRRLTLLGALVLLLGGVAWWLIAPTSKPSSASAPIDSPAETTSAEQAVPEGATASAPAGEDEVEIAIGDQAAALSTLNKALERAGEQELVEIRVVVASAEDVPTLLATFPAFRVHLADRDRKTLVLAGTRATILDFLKRQPACVRFVEPEPIPVLYNKVATGSRFLGLTTLREDVPGLTGEGEVVAVIDTGISTGVAATFHKDLLPGLFGMTKEPTNPATTPIDSSGHGTHVAGSVISRGKTYSSTLGAAPGALLFFQALGTTSDGSIPMGSYDDYYLERGAKAGANIVSCSWGRFRSGSTAYYGDYTGEVDYAAWANPEVLFCFAVGNEGVDANADGVVDASSVYSFEAHAKNILTVGAQESYLPSYTAKTSAYSGGGSPIRGDRMANPYLTYDGMAAFSSRGPLNDGRIAPMLVAPGTAIYSTTKDGSVGDMNGTSMATPLTAGSAAVLRQYLRECHNFAKPTSALLRAGLILCTETLAPGQYGTGDTQEIPNESPNNVEGWGALRLGKTLTGTATLGFRDRITLATGGTDTFTIEGVQANTEVTAVLSYIDYPGKLYKSTTDLINDYDLTLIAPDGTAHSVGDHLNTIERVRATSTVAGDWQVKVSATRISRNGSGNIAAVAWRAETASGAVALPTQAEASAESVTLTVVQPPDSSPYIDFPLYPAPGTNTFSKGTTLTVRAAPKLSTTDFNVSPTYPCGWVLEKADGSFSQGEDLTFSLKLDQSATLRWYTTFPGTAFRLQ